MQLGTLLITTVYRLPVVPIISIVSSGFSGDPVFCLSRTRKLYNKSTCRFIHGSREDILLGSCSIEDLFVRGRRLGAESASYMSIRFIKIGEMDIQIPLQPFLLYFFLGFFLGATTAVFIFIASKVLDISLKIVFVRGVEGDVVFVVDEDCLFIKSLR